MGTRPVFKTTYKHTYKHTNTHTHTDADGLVDTNADSSRFQDHGRSEMSESESDDYDTFDDEGMTHEFDSDASIARCCLAVCLCMHVYRCV